MELNPGESQGRRRITVMCSEDISWWKFRRGRGEVPEAAGGMCGKEGIAQDLLDATRASGRQTPDPVTRLHTNWSALLAAHSMI